MFNNLCFTIAYEPKNKQKRGKHKKPVQENHEIEKTSKSRTNLRKHEKNWKIKHPVIKKQVPKALRRYRT